MIVYPITHVIVTITINFSIVAIDVTIVMHHCCNKYVCFVVVQGAGAQPEPPKKSKDQQQTAQQV